MTKVSKPKTPTKARAKPQTKSKMSKPPKMRLDFTLPRGIFVKRLVHNLLFAILITGGMLFLGMIGYHYFENLPWTQSFLDASMILSGMGPVSEIKTEGGKIFAGIYALFSGILFLVTMAIVFAPLIHTFFNKFHLVEDKTP